ncbi:hypothetical protein [Campylobacter armoricus]|uniref:hypothetical protein n=1 Tax=Campylobacter armoricus TaxID=2505970 RepID=UPI001116784E|nr:hypothetical protein [Campylobacter armoricus]
MSFSLQNFEYERIKILFCDFTNLLNQDFETRMKKAFGVLHFDYLWGVCKEAEKILVKYKKDGNLFDLIMKLYTKKRKIHQANFLLLHCFENALCSTLCVKIAKLYNTSNSDSWFLNRASSSNGLNNIVKLFEKRKKHLKDRKARNEIFHNKPTKIKFHKDLEILLLRLDYNLEDAIKIGEISAAIQLKYNYQGKL